MGISSDAHLGFGWAIEFDDYKRADDLDEWLSENGRDYLAYSTMGHYEDPDSTKVWFLVREAEFYRADCWNFPTVQLDAPREKAVQRAAEEANEWLESIGDGRRIDWMDAAWLLGASVG